MKLTELVVNNQVEIILTSGTKKMSFPCKILNVSPKSGEIFTTVFRVTQGTLIFDNSPVALDLRALDKNSKPYLWKNVRVKKTTYDSKSAYKITSPADGYLDNRREAYRVPIGLSAVIQIGVNRPVDEVMIHDLSATGISFVIKEIAEECIGQDFRISFEDHAYNASFALHGTILRVVKMQDVFLAGCKLRHNYPLVEKYVASKQMKMKKK